MTAEIPNRVGLYRVIRQISENDFMEVYLGEDTNPSYHGDRVVVRRLKPELLAGDPLFRIGFLAEGTFGQRLRHPNVAQTYDVVLQDNVPYMVCEYVDGVLLSDIIRMSNGPVDCAAVAEIGRQVCEGMAAIHEAKDDAGQLLGAVHQYLRPECVGINNRGDVKLLELGITRSRVTGKGGIKLAADSPYSAPEQVAGVSSPTPAADQYAMGAIIFEMLSGIPFLSALEALAKLAEKRESLQGKPGAEDSISARLDDVLEQEVRDSSDEFSSTPPTDPVERQNWARKELPTHLHDLGELPGAGLADILAKMLAYQASERFPSIRAAGAELLRWAWGSGNAIDFRRFIGTLIAQHRGEQGPPPPEAPLLDDQTTQDALEASFVPKAIVLNLGHADSAFLPPSPTPTEGAPARASASVNLAAFVPPEPSGPAPGALLEPTPSAVGTKSATGSQANAGTRRRLNIPGALLGGVVGVLVIAVAVFFGYRTYTGATQGRDSDPTPQAQVAVVAGGEVQSAEVQAMFKDPPPSSGAQPDSPRESQTGGTAGGEAAAPPVLDGFRGLRDGASGAAEAQSGGPLGPEKLVPFKGKRYRGAGDLTVETSPPGARVILDGTEDQTSPVTWESLPAGQHQLILRSDELEMRDVVVIELQGGQSWRGTWSFREKRWISRE